MCDVGSHIRAILSLYLTICCAHSPVIPASSYTVQTKPVVSSMMLPSAWQALQFSRPVHSQDCWAQCMLTFRVFMRRDSQVW